MSSAKAVAEFIKVTLQISPFLRVNIEGAMKMDVDCRLKEKSCGSHIFVEKSTKKV